MKKFLDKKRSAFLLFELLLCLLLISLFLLYFIPTYRNTKRQERALKEHKVFITQCQNWIESCIGNHTIVDYDDNLETEVKVIQETEDYMDLEVTFKNKHANYDYEKTYVFTIEKE